jgi:HSP20 family protein
MAKGQKQDEDLLMEDELAAAFLDDEGGQQLADDAQPAEPAAASDDDWDDSVPGQLAVDVYETKEKLLVKARVAGVDKNDLDVNISDNTLSIHGTLTSGDEAEAENYFVQECYWGEFSRSLALPVPVKEDEIEAVLKDGVLTISFTKLKQDTVKKIEIQ